MYPFLVCRHGMVGIAAGTFSAQKTMQTTSEASTTYEDPEEQVTVLPRIQHSL